MRVRLIVFLLLSNIAALSQQFKKIRLGIGMGYVVTLPTYFSSQNEFSFVGSLEPSYRIDDQISIGIRLEAIGQIIGGGMNIASYSTNFQYNLSNSNSPLRPFLGLGIGYFKPRYVTDGFYGYNSRQEETSLGFYPRIGFDWRHLTVMFDANFVTNSSAIIIPPAINAAPGTLNQLNATYFAFKIGLTIGGGKK